MCPAVDDASTQRAVPRLELPRPTGRHAVGVRTAHLVDHDRDDPFRPGQPRELMVQLWYPAQEDPSAVVDHYVPPTVAGLLLDWWEVEPNGSGLTRDEVAAVVLHGVGGAPLAPAARDCPLVLLSPGHGQYRACLTSLGEDLASRGFLVASIDHPADAVGVEFPDGRVVDYREPDGLEKGDNNDLSTRYLRTRVADVRFALDRLTDPAYWWSGHLNSSKIGIAGHSLGGATAAEAMRLDPRVVVGANVDGTPYGEVLEAGLDRPFLIVQLSTDDPEFPEEPQARAQLWNGLRGWRRHMVVSGAGHMSATDLDVLAGPLGIRECADEEDEFAFGTLARGRGIEITRACLGALFEHHLLDREHPLLDAPSSLYPEIELSG
ncbi:alpha/beta hydrolase family protein [Streptomyces sp. NPDC017979]|uniref:alpha/beta hydrolase family protein n=1 Tax=Streptomyces sp. NPDC017979 TaxID=3365024 RepID=UPI0037B334CB